MKWGDKVAWLQGLAEEGTPPKPLLDQPEVWAHLQWVWQAFSDLSSDRPLGSLGGAGSIPWTAIDRYATRHGIDDPDAFDRFLSLIRAMDRVYLDYAADQAKERERKRPKK